LKFGCEIYEKTHVQLLNPKCIKFNFKLGNRALKEFYSEKLVFSCDFESLRGLKSG
jgi:hypothetical protein